MVGLACAAQLNRATAPVTLVLPLRGVSMLDAPGQPFHDPDADRVLFDTLRASDAAVRWLALPPVDDAGSLGAAWEAVFALVREALESRPTAPIAVQVLAAQHGTTWGDHHGALLGAVSGLLKSAALENPLLRGQVIECAPDVDTALLLRAVRENAATPDAQVRYRDGAREVLDVERLERPAVPGIAWRDGNMTL